MERLRTPQGEALAVWALAGAVTLAVLVTYSRLDPSVLYHTSREGLAGGLSRAVVLLNFPIALVAVALILVAVAALPRAAWWVAAPAIVLCVLVAWPGLVDQDDLDARPANVLPALGVLLALGLTVAAARRAGASFAPRRRWDIVRVLLAVFVVVLSLPWGAVELGFHLPGDLFLGEEPSAEPDGTTIAAVHLGHHHGTDGTLLVLTVLLLSRVRAPKRRLRIALAVYLGAMLAYGAVNLMQDFWLEQFVKRGWTDHRIPSALVPGAEPIWLVVLGLAALSAAVLLREDKRSYSLQ